MPLDNTVNTLLTTEYSRTNKDSFSLIIFAFASNIFSVNAAAAAAAAVAAVAAAVEPSRFSVTERAGAFSLDPKGLNEERIDLLGASA